MLSITNRNHYLVLTTLLLFILITALLSVNIKSFIDSTVTSKFVVFTYVLMVLLIAYMINIICSSKFVLKISKLDYALFFFIVYISFIRYFIQDNYGFSIRYFELIGLSFIYFILRTVPLAKYYWLLLAVIISGIIQAIYGNLQLLGYFPSNHSKFNITGSFFNLGPYAGFLACVWALSLGMYLFKEVVASQIQDTITFSKRYKFFIKKLIFVIPLLGLVSTSLVIPATHSRAAILATVLAGIILLTIKSKNNFNLLKNASKYKRYLGLLLLITIITTVVFGGYKLKQESANGRLLIWKISKDIVADNLFFGVGFDNFKAHYMNYQGDYFLEHKNPNEIALAGNSKYAFNEFMQLTVENGVLGFVSMLLILYLIFSLKLKKDSNYIGQVLKVLIITISVFAFFSYPSQILPIKLILVVALVGIATLDENKASLTLFEQKNTRILFKGSFLVCGITLLFYTYSNTLTLTSGFKKWKQASYDFNTKWYKDSIKKYESILSVFYNYREFLGDYGQAFSINQEHEKAIKHLLKAKVYYNNNTLDNTLGNSYKALQQYKEAESAYKVSANMVPTLFYPNYLLAKLYEDSGQKNKAIEKANEILGKDIKIHTQAIDEIHTEMKKLITKHKTSGL